MEMEPVTSSLISHRGHDPETQIMWICFTSKTHKFGSLYEYGNVSSTLYAAGCEHLSDRTGEPSFGQWFQQEIKPKTKEYPFRKLADPQNTPPFPPFDLGAAAAAEPARDTATQTTDFASGQPIPVAESEPAEPLIPDTPRITAARTKLYEMPLLSTAEDREAAETELKAAQEEALQQEFDRIKAKLAEVGKVEGGRIIIASPEAAALAFTTGNMIARWRADLEKTMRPEIDRLRAPYTAALAIFNRYNNPLKDDQDRLRVALAEFQRLERQREEEANRQLRRQQELEAEQEAKRKAEELHLDDAIAAEARGDAEVADMIMASKPLPMAPSLPAPMRVASAVPAAVANAKRQKWAWEMIDESKIPDEYWVVDTKAIDKLVGAIGERANTALNGAIRAYDAGTVAFSKK